MLYQDFWGGCGSLSIGLEQVIGTKGDYMMKHVFSEILKPHIQGIEIRGLIKSIGLI